MSAEAADRVVGLVAALRAHGLRVGTGETVDAAEAAAVLGFADRAVLREGLAAALLHSPDQRRVFDTVFDLYFPYGVGAPQGGPGDRDDLRERLAAALADDDATALARLAVEAVDGFGGYGSSPGADGWSSYQALERLRPQTLLARVRDDVRSRGGGPGFTDRLLEDEIRRRIEVFRTLVAGEARRR
ncbi:hypothetical protein JHN52_17700, partial [Streptomyces sp. MBT97]|nr:hypothetical protein [Streptomyces sp. MBT97]